MSELARFEALRPYTIEGLRKRVRRKGAIHIKGELVTSYRFRKYLIDYPSGELKITGILNVPVEGLSQPVVILNHGYVPTERYKSGDKTNEIGAYLAANGYLTISPDFRGWGESDSGDDFFRSGLVSDVLNLIDALPSLPTADPRRIGLWGHSMGAVTALKVITVDDRIKASVLCAPLPLHDAEIPARWNNVNIETVRDKADSIRELYREALEDSDFLERTSPSKYLPHIAGPVQIHTGAKDNVARPRWAEEVLQALKALGKTVEMYTYHDQGHYLRGDDLALMFKRCKVFFDHYLQ